MDPNAVRGHLEPMILAVLESGPLHGYAVIMAIKNGTGGELELNTGSVYPALRRLEDAGHIRGSWQVVDGRRRRTYRLTAAGSRALAKQRTDWQLFTRTIGGVLDS
ncbi:MAG: PadR family transcriptional regulator [Streptosporangiales bacterium]|nr:PadR family transcriptional regulator [Streptosporangiales bacterium]